MNTVLRSIPLRMCTRGLMNLALAFSVIMVAGCAATPRITDIEVPVEGQTVVFGGVDVLEDGEPKKWGMTWTGDQRLSLLILPPGKS